MQQSDLYSLASLRELYLNNEDFVVKTIEVFVHQIGQDVLKLNENLAAGDWKDLRSTAHKIKPNIDLLEMTSIKTDIRDIEKTASKNTSDEMRMKVKKITETINAVTSSLQEYLDNQKH
jgi:HPt (histidine-containing phosphotransfer) domain-containing protein